MVSSLEMLMCCARIVIFETQWLFPPRLSQVFLSFIGWGENESTWYVGH
jgi:hypothetical protein